MFFRQQGIPDHRDCVEMVKSFGNDACGLTECRTIKKGMFLELDWWWQVTKNPRSKKTKDQKRGKNISVQGSVSRSTFLIGDKNKIINYQNPTDDLIPNIDEGESPLPSCLSFYRNAPLAKFGGIFTNKHDPLRVFFVFVVAVMIYAGGIFCLRTIQGTPLPPSMADLFLYIAPGEYFYYPDWNAFTFDFVLNPLAVVLSIFYHQIIFEYLSHLTRSGALRINDIWDRRLSSKGWGWCAIILPLVLGIAAIVLSWTSRYQYYVNDLYILRFYVLGLIGFSTYLRSSMLISLLHAAIFLSVGAANIPLDILNSASRPKYQRLGDSCLLINFASMLIFLYALTTIYTSIVKSVNLQDDYLFWEAVVHLIAVISIFLYFNYKQILVANHIQQLKEDYTKRKLKSETDSTRHHAIKIYLKDIPNHPIWISLGKHWPILSIVFLAELLPMTLFIVGRNSL